MFMFAAPFRLEDTCCTELCVICMRTIFFLLARKEACVDFDVLVSMCLVYSNVYPQEHCCHYYDDCHLNYHHSFLYFSGA